MREQHVRLMLIRQPVISRAFLPPGVAGVVCIVAFLRASIALGKNRGIRRGGPVAVVVDDRLAALRSQPDPSARLLRRISRGRFLSIRGSRRSHDGLLFYQVAVTRRTLGWLQ